MKKLEKNKQYRIRECRQCFLQIDKDGDMSLIAAENKEEEDCGKGNTGIVYLDEEGKIKYLKTTSYGVCVFDTEKEMFDFLESLPVVSKEGSYYLENLEKEKQAV